MRAAVTGATGFVGRHLVEALRERGTVVRCLVRGAARGAELREAGAELVPGALEDAEALHALVGGADVVYHVAGLLAAGTEAELLRVNGEGTARLARAAREAGAGRLLLVSSLAVTGPTRPGSQLDETAAEHPLTPYARSKQAAEAAVRGAGVPFTIVRPCAVYGPGDAQFLRVFRLARRGVAPLLGDGRQELTLVHARDLAAALVAAAESPATRGGVYHAGHGTPLTQRELVEAIGRAMGRRVHVVPLPRGLVRALLALSGSAVRAVGRSTLLSSDKAEELLAPAWTCSSEALARDAGWRARISLKEGLAETARWYRAAGWL
jgi:nucleoside-diphosphate-sugar epimerase